VWQWTFIHSQQRFKTLATEATSLTIRIGVPPNVVQQYGLVYTNIEKRVTQCGVKRLQSTADVYKKAPVLHGFFKIGFLGIKHKKRQQKQGPAAKPAVTFYRCRMFFWRYILLLYTKHPL
jgi:hypothetical protein